jgi:hypothetical protein
MADQVRPNIVGKGPSLVKEMLTVFKEIERNTGVLSDNASEKIKSVLSEKGQAIESVVRMAYLKTVKAGEIAYDCKQMALELKGSIESGNEDNTLQILDKLGNELDGFIHKIKAFVVRMT